MPLSTIIKGKLSAVSPPEGGGWLTQIMIFGKRRLCRYKGTLAVL